MKALAVTGASFAALGIAVGAFGTHALRASVSVSELEIWKTAATYLILNGVGLLALSTHSTKFGKTAGTLISIGAGTFAIALITLAITGVRSFGAVAPIGGTLMIAGWVLAAVSLAGGTIRP